MKKDKAEKLSTVGESYILSFVITSHHQQKEGELLWVLKTCGIVEEEEEEGVVVIVTSALCIVRWTKARGESSRISKLIKVETKKRVSRRFLRQTARRRRPHSKRCLFSSSVMLLLLTPLLLVSAFKSCLFGPSDEEEEEEEEQAFPARQKRP